MGPHTHSPSPNASLPLPYSVHIPLSPLHNRTFTWLYMWAHTFCPVTSSCEGTCIHTPHPCRRVNPVHTRSRARRAGLGKVVNLIHGVCVCPGE